MNAESHWLSELGDLGPCPMGGSLKAGLLNVWYEPFSPQGEARS